jgi:hypothetical protein
MNPNQRYDGAIALIKSQTNYTEEQASEKLKEWKGNYMNVIKEYLNPNFNKKKEEIKKKSTNETMMYEIRNFMDTASADFLRRKEAEEKKQEYLKNVYEKFLEIKKQYPECLYNPPGVVSCNKDCKNPLCPGELLPGNIYSKMKKECVPCNDEKNEIINL